MYIISGFKAPLGSLDSSSSVQLFSESVQNYLWCRNSWLHVFRFGLLWTSRNVYDQARNLAWFGYPTFVLRSLLRCHYQRHCWHVYRSNGFNNRNSFHDSEPFFYISTVFNLEICTCKVMHDENCLVRFFQWRWNAVEAFGEDNVWNLWRAQCWKGRK